LALERPLVLLVEDLHWADSASLGLLLYLGHNLHDACMLVVGTYRDVDVGSDHPLEATLRELVRERLVDELALHELLRIADLPEPDLLDDLDAAFRARLIVESRAGTLERYAFAHALIQHSLYAELPPHRLRRLHQRVGEALEGLRAAAPEASAELAYHFVKLARRNGR
jgi:predicted ATPase